VLVVTLGNTPSNDDAKRQPDVDANRRGPQEVKSLAGFASRLVAQTGLPKKLA
jgi:hypothetical protein